MSLPKPNDAFHWVQAAAGAALVCRPLEPHAAHLFTTRQWPLGTADTGERAAAWGDVARALDVDAAQLSRLHQVHGTSVVVLRRGGSTAPEGYGQGNVLASYVHAHWASNPMAAEGFVSACATFARAR